MTGPELLRELERQGRHDAAPASSSPPTDPRRGAQEMQGLSAAGTSKKPLRPEVMRDVLSELAERILAG